MSNLYINKTIIILFIISLAGCAPLIPDNYLGPTTIRTPQKINGQWKEPRLIPISVKMLHTPEGHELLEPALKPQPYHVGSFDSLNIIVWGHPALSTLGSSPTAIPDVQNSFTNSIISTTSPGNPAINVEVDGTIFYPYVGRLHVAGMTISQIQAAITRRLSAYIRNPQVTVQVVKFANRHIYVQGEVRAPGVFPLTDKPLTLMEAISKAGGINPASADPTHIYLVRGSYEQPDVFWLNAQTPQALLIAEQFPLQEGDIVYISAAGLNSWANFVNQILPNFNTYYTIKGLAK